MLKIKNNIDLKELEKYGFRKRDYYFEQKNIHVITYASSHLLIDSNRKIEMTQRFDGEKPYSVTMDILYSIIQAGLVEKVE